MALNPKQFGTVMKNARNGKKLTQAELAEILVFIIIFERLGAL